MQSILLGDQLFGKFKNKQEAELFLKKNGYEKMSVTLSGEDRWRLHDPRSFDVKVRIVPYFPPIKRTNLPSIKDKL